jgi:hypothetical protein
MQNIPQLEESLADDIVGDFEYEAPGRQKKEFLPWHRPRKQFVRDRQWRKEIQELISERNSKGDTLKYLGLPGVDLLDLRYFHNTVCEPNKLKLRFLGFNSAAAPNSEAQTELNISSDEVKRLPWVDHSSNVIHDDFRLVGNTKSIAYKETLDSGPYDIVNLDLCDGFAKQAPQAKQAPGKLEVTHYDAMNQLLSIQARNSKPWLLFLTTRVGKNDINKDALEKLLSKYEHCLLDCEAFREASSTHFKITNNEELSQAITSEEGLINVFLTGICKWLLGCALGQNPPTKIKLKSVIGYRVALDAAHEDLISLALKFEPIFIAANDPIGLAKHSANTLSECELAPKIVSKVANRTDADKCLDENESLHNEMTNSMAGLLELARYDVTEFHRWVQAGYPVPQS